MKDYELILKEILANSDVCFLSSITDTGYPKTRAMLLPVKIENNTFYFHTNTSSGKTKEFRNNGKSCIYFCDPSSFKGISFEGKMEIIDDEETIKGFWQDSYSMYYKGGLSGGDFTLMRFTAHKFSAYANMNAWGSFL